MDKLSEEYTAENPLDRQIRLLEEIQEIRYNLVHCPNCNVVNINLTDEEYLHCHSCKEINPIECSDELFY